MELILAITGGVTLLIGVVLIALTMIKINKSKSQVEIMILEAEKQREKILGEAKIEAQSAVKKLEQNLEKEHSNAMKGLRKKESEVERRFSLVDDKQEKLTRLEKKIEERENQSKRMENQIAARQNEVEKVLEQEKKELSKISELSRDQARDILLSKLKTDVESESTQLIAKTLENAKQNAEEDAKEILMDVMQRITHNTTTELSTVSVNLPKEEIKGKIIGREGRNIRSFERATGVDVIIDETPEVITLSCFDSYRREIAKVALEKLIKDGRIHPQRIEEVVVKTEEEMGEETRKVAEQTLIEAGFNDIHPELVKVFGKLRFRLSYGQNQIQHSLQVMELCDYIAQELKLDQKLARRCGLLHDIGKAIDQEQEGTHPALGYEIAKKYGEDPIVLNAIAAHHEGVEVESIYTTITAVADAISAARPGARRENTEKYFQRMEQLEEVAESFQGVNKAFAMSAGRELRVSVEAGKVSDQEGIVLARNIANAVEDKVTYPGEVKVTLIRETRFVEFAR